MSEKKTREAAASGPIRGNLEVSQDAGGELDGSTRMRSNPSTDRSGDVIKQKGGNHPAPDGAELRKRNARFDQELADSRDHDKQSGQRADQTLPAAPAKKTPGKI